MILIRVHILCTLPDIPENDGVRGDPHIGPCVQILASFPGPPPTCTEFDLWYMYAQEKCGDNYRPPQRITKE